MNKHLVGFKWLALIECLMIWFFIKMHCYMGYAHAEEARKEVLSFEKLAKCHNHLKPKVILSL